jgi:replication initiation and membrane attachment protein DnaB
MFASSVTLVNEIAKVRLEDQTCEHDTQMNDHTPDPVPQVFQSQAAAPASGSGRPLGFELGVDPGFEAPSFDFDLDLFSKMLEQEPIPVQVQS